MIKPIKITFATLKGGTGKTTSAFTTAGILAEKGHKVLLVDADPQANLTSNLGIDETVDGFKSIVDLLENDKSDVSEIMVRSYIRELPTLDIIPSCIGLTSTEMRIISLAGREFLLKNHIKRQSSVFNDYDFIIFDTNPSMSIINQNVFVISDAIILTSEIGKNSFKGAQLFIALWEEILERMDMPNNIKGFLVTQFDNRNKLSKDYYEFCQEDEEIKKIIFKNKIPVNVKIPEAEVENKPVNIYSKESASSEAYKNFVDELLKRLL